MTVHGWDGSHYDFSRGPMDLGAAYRDGIRLFTCKATEGVTYRDPNLGAALNRAHDAGIPVLGAYHVVHTAPPIAAQVAYLIAYLDSAVPWWHAHPNFIIQVDLERWQTDSVPATVGCAFADAARHATGKYVIVYASKGQYGNSVPAGCDLWNANYPSSRAAHYSALYPGDNGPGWTAYSGRTPIIWQYASTATIGTQTGCDANAYRGSLDQLLALTRSGGTPPVAPNPEGTAMFVAHDSAGMIYLCDGIRSKAVPFAQRGPLQSLINEGLIPLVGPTLGSGGRAGWDESFGKLDTGPAPATAVLSDVQLEAIAAAITSHTDIPLGDKDIPAVVKALKTYYAAAQAAP